MYHIQQQIIRRNKCWRQFSPSQQCHYTSSCSDHRSISPGAVVLKLISLVLSWIAVKSTSTERFVRVHRLTVQGTQELPCFFFARILFTFSDLESVDSESSISFSLVIMFSSLNRTGFMILRLDLHIGCSMFVLFFGTWMSWLFALELSDWVSSVSLLSVWDGAKQCAGSGARIWAILSLFMCTGSFSFFFPVGSRSLIRCALMMLLTVNGP